MIHFTVTRAPRVYVFEFFWDLAYNGAEKAHFGKEGLSPTMPPGALHVSKATRLMLGIELAVS